MNNPNHKYLLWGAVLLLMSTVPTLAAHGGPGRFETPLYAGQTIDAGTVSLWNSKYTFELEIETRDGWLISEAHVYVGFPDVDPIPANKNGNIKIGHLPYKEEYSSPVNRHMLTLGLEEDLEFTWGGPYFSDSPDPTVATILVHAALVQLDEDGRVVAEEGAWAVGDPLDANHWGWYVTYKLHKPMHGQFLDDPVFGLGYRTPTHVGLTGDWGGYHYFPGEQVEFRIGDLLLGSEVGDERMSPLDLYPNLDITDPLIVGMATTLQTLDSDGTHYNGSIVIDPGVAQCFSDLMAGFGITEFEQIDFADVEILNGFSELIVGACGGGLLTTVTPEDAVAHLEATLHGNRMFRKNMSKTPPMESAKAKLNIMPQWFPAMKADGSAVELEYYDELGQVERTTTEAKPLVSCYTDAIEAGAADVFCGVSRDDGKSWKRKNVSRAADRSSFTLLDGTEFLGHAKKPVFHVKGNNIFVAWTSKFCRGGKPRYAIDTEDDYSVDDVYFTEDIWGVSGPQRSIDYTLEGFPEVGEVPYSCVWTVRGVVATASDVSKGLGDYPGDIVWFKPERLTSGRRDAYQMFAGGASGAGFAIVWQEDPKGLRPGDGAGPGHGWSGATVSHKTDVWYSYIAWSDFKKIDSDFPIGGDPEHDLEITSRPKALVPMSLPVRVTNNDVLNTDNLMVLLDANNVPIRDVEGNCIPDPNADPEGDGDGTHIYGCVIPELCVDTYSFINNAGDEKHVCITADGKLMDGDTGASRPNLFLQTYTNSNGTPSDPTDDFKSAWAIMAYEETKGVGGGAPDHTMGDGPYGDEYVPDEGKNVVYHSFEFKNPELVSGGTIVNLPATDEDGNVLYLEDEYGNLILDYLGQPQLAYENARRPRFVLQSKSAMGASKTVMAILYKEGEEGHGRPSDIMLRRVAATTSGNPYKAAHIVPGVVNMSSTTADVTWENPDCDPDAQGDCTKVVRWSQGEGNLNDRSKTNPHDDARAHRGQIRGDFVVMGYSYTPDWASARNGNENYDLYVRRSFDGGQTWTTDPAGVGVANCETFTDPETKEKEEVCTEYAAGQFEGARNVSRLANNKTTVAEPRIVATPGTIKDPATGAWTGVSEDKQNKNVFFVSYGTASNPGDPHGEDPEPVEEAVPLDIYWSRSIDRGESYQEVLWDINGGSDGELAGETVKRWGWLANGDPLQGEAQLRCTPDGSRFYATWQQEGLEGSDIWFRRIIPEQEVTE